MSNIEKYAEAPAALTPAERGSNLIREAAAVMTDAHALATAICKTAMVPDHFRGKPDETAAAILYGASLGLDPMQSLKAVYVVYGNAAMYARSMAGLVVAAGHEIWTVEAGPTRVVVSGRRKGEETIETGDWTIERAAIAGYVPTKDPATGKWKTNEKGKVIGNEKYLTDPQAMLRAKATAEVCRIIAPDVLAGVYSVEERQMEYVEAEVVSTTRPSRGLAGVLPAASEEKPAAKEKPAAESPLLNPRSSLAKRMFAALGEAGITAKDDRLDYCSGQVGREVKTSSELTDVEAEAIIASLQIVQEPAAPEVEPEAEQ
ncbi:MAG: recombinase RecT [Nocardioidaceae bacterium]